MRPRLTTELPLFVSMLMCAGPGVLPETGAAAMFPRVGAKQPQMDERPNFGSSAQARRRPRRSGAFETSTADVTRNYEFFARAFSDTHLPKLRYFFANASCDSAVVPRSVLQVLAALTRSWSFSSASALFAFACCETHLP